MRRPVIIVFVTLLTSCASLKKNVDTGNRIILTDSTLGLIEGRYERESVQLDKDSFPSADLYWNLYANTYSFILGNDKGLNQKGDTNFIELKVVNKNKILSVYTSGSEVLTSKVLKGKVKNGYFVFRRKYLFLPFVFANIYRNSKFRIGLLNDMNLIADYKEVGFATIYVILPDFRNISENDMIFKRIKRDSSLNCR